MSSCIFTKYYFNSQTTIVSQQTEEISSENEILSISKLNVSKSEKKGQKFSILPKKQTKHENVILSTLMIVFLKTFVRFLEVLIIPKFAFEIY